MYKIFRRSSISFKISIFQNRIMLPTRGGCYHTCEASPLTYASTLHSKKGVVSTVIIHAIIPESRQEFGTRTASEVPNSHNTVATSTFRVNATISFGVCPKWGSNSAALGAERSRSVRTRWVPCARARSSPFWQARSRSPSVRRQAPAWIAVSRSLGGHTCPAGPGRITRTKQNGKDNALKNDKKRRSCRPRAK